MQPVVKCDIPKKRYTLVVWVDIVTLGFGIGVLLWRLGKLLLPKRVYLRGVYVGEDEVKDFFVPGDWLALDTLFDVL